MSAINPIHSNQNPIGPQDSSISNSSSASPIKTAISQLFQGNAQEQSQASQNLSAFIKHGSQEAITQSIQVVQSQIDSPSLPLKNTAELMSSLESIQNKSSTPSAIGKDITNLSQQINKASSNHLTSLKQLLYLNRNELYIPGEEGENVSMKISQDNIYRSNDALPLIDSEIAKAITELGLKYDPVKSNPQQDTFIADNFSLILSKAFRDAQMRLNFPRITAQMFGGKRMGFIMGFIQVGFLPPIFYISPLVYDLLVKMGYLKDQRNLFKCAFVVESVGSMTGLDKAKNVELISSNQTATEQTLSATYQNLFDEGYLKIISLHLHPLFSKNFHNAKNAAESFTESITVEDLHTNGLGLGMFVKHMNKLIKENYSPNDLLELIHQAQKSTKYWAIGLDFDLNLHKWLEKTLEPREKFKLRRLNHIPLFELGDTFKLVGLFSNEEAAFAQLDQILESHVRKCAHIHSIGVEYRTAYRKAINYQNKLKSKYKKTISKPFIAGSNTNQFLGPNFIGVCVV